MKVNDIFDQHISWLYGLGMLFLQGFINQKKDEKNMPLVISLYRFELVK